jgi:hypothetical protein
MIRALRQLGVLGRLSNNIAYEPVFLPPADPLALRW